MNKKSLKRSGVISAIALSALLTGCSSSTSHNNGGNNNGSNSNSISKIALNVPMAKVKGLNESDAKIMKAQVKVSNGEELILTMNKSFTKDTLLKASNSNAKTSTTLNLSKKVNNTSQDDFILDLKNNDGKYILNGGEDNKIVKNITPAFNGNTITIPLNKDYLLIGSESDFQVQLIFSNYDEKKGPTGYQSIAKTRGFTGLYSNGNSNGNSGEQEAG